MEGLKSKKIRQNSGDDEDRLISLPDCVLCYILSFLETKYVIRISVLSKRFRNLWSSLPSLNFDSSSFWVLQKFDKFVNRVLALRDTSVRVESLKFHRLGKTRPYLLKKIIYYTMSRGVLRLDIKATSSRSYSFPESVYSSESLRIFELRIDAELKKPLSFPKLTKLHLSGVSLTHSDLLSTCPCLMELTLSGCYLHDLGILNIDSPTLTKLTIGSSCCSSGSVSCKVVVSAPKLASFCYSGYDWQRLSISSELSDLEVISLDVRIWPSQLQEKEKQVQSNLIKLLQPFRNAKYVILSLHTIQEVLSKLPDLLQGSSPFVNVKSLIIKTRNREKSLVIPTHVKPYLLGDPPRAQAFCHAKYPCFKRCNNECPQHENCKWIWQW